MKNNVISKVKVFKYYRKLEKEMIQLSSSTMKNKVNGLIV